MTPLEAVRIFERYSGKRFTVEHVAEETLQARLRSATDPLEQTFSALMLDYANGCPTDMRETLAILPMHLTTLEEFADSTLGEMRAHA